LFHEHSNTIQVFEIPHFEITPILRMLHPRKIFLARARPEVLFLFVLHYKIRGGPPKPWPGPSLAQKLRPDASSGMVMDRIFSGRNNRIFFSPAPTQPGPKNAQVYYQRRGQADQQANQHGAACLSPTSQHQEIHDLKPPNLL
jgi:hypothetical protein